MTPSVPPRRLLARLALPLALALALARAPGAPAEDAVTMLPAPVEDYAVARSGECLVLKIQGQKGLTVYSTRSKALRTLDLPTSDFAFGAGGNRAVVSLKESNELQSFDLATLQPVKSKEFADPINVLRIVMGHSRDGLALLRVSRGGQPFEQVSNPLLNVETLSIVRAKTPDRQIAGHNTSLQTGVHHRATGDLSRITEWATSHTPSGVGVYDLAPDGSVKAQYAHETAGFLAAGDDRLVYTGGGVIYDPDQPPVPPFHGMARAGEVRDKSLIPGVGGQFYLGLGYNGTLTLYQSGRNIPLALVGKFPGWEPPARPPNFGPPASKADPAPGLLEPFTNSRITLDKRTFFAPGDRVLLFLPPPGDRLVQREFDLKALLDAGGKDYLLVLNRPPLRSKAGASWQYAIETLARHAPVTFRLQTAPEGMTIAPDGKMAWKIPAGIEGKAKVVVVITDPRANETRNEFEVAFD